MNTGKKAAFHTLGCKLNYSETSTISRLFEEQGYQKVEFDQPADVYVINTCSVTANADKECKQIVKQALKVSPHAFIVVTGCYAQLKPDQISNISGVDLVIGANEKFKLLDHLNSLEKKQKAEIHSCEIDDVNTFVGSYSVGDRTRAFLKVQDGCDYTCSYCTIPLARGKNRSDSISNVIKNANEIAAKGIKEIVLTGVNIGDFGFGHSGTAQKKTERFIDLIKELDNVESIERFRISSIEPNLLTDEIIDFVSTSKRFMPHFHIPLQSGCDKTLKAMRRRYMSELYVNRVTKIKQVMPHVCIGVDVIVGFPGETDEDYTESYNFINQLDISYLHVFTYSERDHTDAIHLKPVVPQELRKDRNKMLRILSAKKTRAFYEQHIGHTRPVLFEHENKNGLMFGFSDNYVKVSAPHNESFSNQIINVNLSSFDEDGNVKIEAAAEIEAL